jgi:hypothetical protein
VSASTDIATLEARRDRIRRELAAVGDLRPGSLGSRRIRCGNPNCRCKREGEPGHGPYWYLTSKQRGRSVAHSIPAAAVERTRRQVAEHKRLRRLIAELVEVSDRLCQAQLVRD